MLARRAGACAAGLLGQPVEAPLQEDPRPARGDGCRTAPHAARAAAARCRIQRPDLRNHKLLVVDGAVGFVGSQNVTDSSYNLPKNIKRGLHWVDLMAKVDGPVVASINAIFLADYYAETDSFAGYPAEITDRNQVRDGGTRGRRPPARLGSGDIGYQVFDLPSDPDSGSRTTCGCCSSSCCGHR